MTGPDAGSSAVLLETERLILRPHRAEDIAAYAPLWRPPAAGVAYTPVLDEEGAWARLLRLIGHRQVFGFGPWLVVERASGAVVGEVGHARFRRSVGTGFDEAPEAMWIFDAAVHGRGFAGEAMRAATAAFDARPEGARTVCMIDPTNAPSLRLAARLGFVAFDRRTRNGHDVVLFERVQGERGLPRRAE